MDFFEQQNAARRRTGRLIVYFILAVAAIVVAIYFIVLIALVFVGDSGRPGQPNPYMETPWHPGLFAVVALATIGVILLGSLYKTSQLASGGEAVALMMGGRPIDRQTRDLAERRLLNVVDEMALASGTPVPPVYVMDNEPSINAFAAGHQPGDAVIGVSRGCLDYLTRDELQGVMAHEFSHILNGDMRMNLRLVGILHGILVIALLGWFVLRSMRYSGRRSQGDKGGGALAMILAIGGGLLLVGSVGLLFGKLIKSAVSRQREYLADASAVQFTRLPEGIAGALKKIGGRPETSKIEDAHAEEISHMFFGSALGSLRYHLFSTHPPLVRRIRQIDPAFDGNFPKRVKPLKDAAELPKPQKKPGKPLQTGRAGGTTPLDPSGVLGRVGVLDLEQLVYAAAILEGMPEPLRAAAAEPYAARAVIYAILLSQDAEMLRRQLDALRPKAEELSYRETERLASLIDGLPQEARLPLVETTLPALKKLSPDQYGTFRENVEALIKADDKLDLLEYAVQAMLLGQLDVQFGRSRPVAVRYRQVDPLLPSLVGLLSTLAYAGQTAEADVKRAFDKAMAEIGRKAAPLAKSDCSMRSFDAALKTLAETTPELKRQIFTACVACVAADGKVTPREGQLVQVIAALLGLPIPPIRATVED
jgi:Zn-dependent protease with chaperone function